MQLTSLLLVSRSMMVIMLDGLMMMMVVVVMMILYGCPCHEMFKMDGGLNPSQHGIYDNIIIFLHAYQNLQLRILMTAKVHISSST